jgi:hypothetical protein
MLLKATFLGSSGVSGISRGERASATADLGAFLSVPEIFVSDKRHTDCCDEA